MEGSEELEKALRVARGRALADTGEPRHEGEERGGKGFWLVMGEGRGRRIWVMHVGFSDVLDTVDSFFKFFN